MCTAMTGMMSGFWGLLMARLLCGITEAGAYPTCMAVIRKWIPLGARARASGLVALGGRIGGTLAPFLTIWMIVTLGSWRTSLWLDGCVGFLIAGIYWLVVRSNPREHPAVNAAELAVIGTPPVEKPLNLTELLKALWAFTLSRSLWCNAANQFLTNVGWAFLVTWLPTYLMEERHVGEVEGGRMVTYVLAFGMLGQLVGGYYCDWSTRRLGLRWGRVLPISTSMLVCAAAYLCCPFVHSTWVLVGCLAIVSMGVDVANPATWAFVSDVGGRATAAAGGWGNMWGNFGAAAISVVGPWLQKKSVGHGPMVVFFPLAGACLLAAIIVLGMDASKKVLPEDQ